MSDDSLQPQEVEKEVKIIEEKEYINEEGKLKGTLWFLSNLLFIINKIIYNK